MWTWVVIPPSVLVFHRQTDRAATERNNQTITKHNTTIDGKKHTHTVPTDGTKKRYGFLLFFSCVQFPDRKRKNRPFISGRKKHDCCCCCTTSGIALMRNISSLLMNNINYLYKKINWTSKQKRRHVFRLIERSTRISLNCVVVVSPIYLLTHSARLLLYRLFCWKSRSLSSRSILPSSSSSSSLFFVKCVCVSSSSSSFLLARVVVYRRIFLVIIQ
jgi:hypothetical protein